MQMKLKTRMAFATGILIWGALWVSLLSGFAAAAQIGMVDVERVYQTSNYFQSQLTKLQDFGQQKFADAQQKTQLFLPQMLLSPEELETYRTLLTKKELTKKELTKAEELQRQELETTSGARQKQLKSLKDKPDAQLTQEERQQLTELQPIYDAAVNRTLEYQKLVDSLQAEMDKQQQEVMGGLQKILEETIASLAKDKGLDCVLRKSIYLPGSSGSDQLIDLCLWVKEGSDITEEVIAAIDKKAAESTPATPATPGEAPKSP